MQGKSQISSTEMVKEILKLRDAHFVGPFDIESIADKVGVKDITDRILFFQAFDIVAKDFSENLFPDQEGRNNIINAIQLAIDDAVAVEDEMYDDNTKG